MIGYSNETLANLPPIEAGDDVKCRRCGEMHTAQDSDPPGLLFIYCPGGYLVGGAEPVEAVSYLVGLNGKKIHGVPADASEDKPPVAVCDACWDLVAPERVPSRVTRPGHEKGDEAFCGGCGRRTYSGIYVLEDAAERLRARLAQIAAARPGAPDD